MPSIKDAKTIAKIGLAEYLARIDAIEQLEAERQAMQEDQLNDA
jgi:uncharacterized protein (UPF0335 family)